MSQQGLYLKIHEFMGSPDERYKRALKGISNDLLHPWSDSSYPLQPSFYP